MDTNSNTPPQKKIINVEILHLDETGYGPQGTHTRREWRNECLWHLLQGDEIFNAWQFSWEFQIKPNLKNVSFAVELGYQDGSKLGVLSKSWDDSRPYTFDFVGHTFKTALDVVRFIFRQTVIFHSGSFIENADFSGSTFKENVYFDNVTFCRAVNFNAITVAWLANFVHAKFYEDGNFSEAVFGARADFRNATFTRNANFQKSTVSGLANFNGVIFNEHAEFSNIIFNGFAFFNISTQ
jgi:hypothetical protein